MEKIFVYGTLRDPEVLELALDGKVPDLSVAEAVLTDHVTLGAQAGPYPLLKPRPGARAPGLLLQSSGPDLRRQLEQFEGDFGYRLEARTLETPDGPETASVFLTPETEPDTGEIWDLDTWQATRKALYLAMAMEISERGLSGAELWREMPGILRRGIATSRAKASTVEDRHGSGLTRDDLYDHRRTRLHTGFFHFEAQDFAHARFDGGRTGVMQREVLVSGDAVTILPWDPVTDQVLLIEQIRAGIIARGDPRPWGLEPVAGLCDQDEHPEQTARREAREEAGLEIGRVHLACSYYSSPGLLTEYVSCFIGEADLATHTPGIHGLDAENEDIRSVILTFDDAMAALDRGEVRNAHLRVVLLDLFRVRDDLRARWVS